MQLMAFNTDVVSQDVRLATFRAGAMEFQVDALGDASAFRSQWRMLKLGDINVIHSCTSAVRYRRDAERIAADGQDRFALHYCLRGGEAGEINGRSVRVGVGGAMVWDLSLPLDLAWDGDVELIIVTLPRLLVQEVLPALSLAGPLAPSPELSLAIEQARYMIDHAAELPEGAAVFLGRALRDMLAVALLPSCREASPQPDAPLLQRIVDLIDAGLPEEPRLERLAAQLQIALGEVASVVEHFGGLPLLAERRRLLAAYRLLGDPRETGTVLEIAQRCGFRSLPQFSRRFSGVFHTSASDLRRYGRGRLPRWAGAYHVEQLYGALAKR